MKLTGKQQIQESQYHVPYHWFIKPDTGGFGRVYFGYLSICLEEFRTYFNGDISNRVVLDAGCGDGRFLKILKDEGVTNIYGCDYSDKALAFSELLIGGGKFSQADLTKEIPFPDNHFDAVFLIETLEHIIPEDIDILMKNLSKMIKPGGLLIVTVPSVNVPVNDKHYQHFSEESLRKVLSPIFSVKKIIGQSRSNLWLRILYRLFDNRLYQIRPLVRFYNTKVWPRFFNRCSPYEGERLIAVSIKMQLYEE